MPARAALCLKWGEALLYVRKRDNAKSRIARANQFDITPTDEKDLARHSPHA
jgi:hypothetical protein